MVSSKNYSTHLVAEVQQYCALLYQYIAADTAMYIDSTRCSDLLVS